MPPEVPEVPDPVPLDPGITAQLVQTLIGLVQSAASPDAIEAQNMILRRMALEGDVIGSRIPPPRNISEIGGYLNLLGTLKETTMREQALAGILGVAGPAMPLGWITNDLPLSMVAVSNDRPPVAAQASFPLSVLVRSDFVAGVQAAFKTLHGYGATLPLTGPIGARLAISPRTEIQNCEVRECMDEPCIIPGNTSFFDAIGPINKNQYTLIMDSSTKKITGIVTSSDLNEQFRELVEPFLLIEEIETHIRSLIARSGLSKEQLSEAVGGH